MAHTVAQALLQIFTTKSIILSQDELESSYRNAALYPTAWEGVKGEYC